MRGKPRNCHELMLLVLPRAVFDIRDSVEDLLHVFSDLCGERVNAG